MIHFEGNQAIPLPPAEVAAKLSDAGFLANCVPDAQVSEATADHSVGKIKPKLSFLTGSLTLDATVTARDAGKSVAYKIDTKTMGASSTVETKLEFKDGENGGTLVHWAGDLVAVTGLLKMVPKGLLEGTAKKVIEDVWAAVAARLTTG
ncbi:Carbon monoxide dehydrogenase subunit G (CoxG) [Gemmata sp. SH-PL17]|uniref:SRPBCC domain-containing protein n=1 Tax=Gemmata sp. SH-PL17 TaxID=1630693 RepID=UPI0004B52F6E|nr:SRPBCC domain-containing protein [Gemmata sp. SH-PL17]AMV23570.1 Carbon monoxide dehydrogenase subunit G (CoxG) [Gemmata sp. SH-PL17]